MCFQVETVLKTVGSILPLSEKITVHCPLSTEEKAIL